MDNKCAMQFHKKFDEDEIDHHHNLVLANVNLYLYRKCPELQNTTHLKFSKSSRSVLDLCGMRMTKTEMEKEKFRFVCLLGNCYKDVAKIKIHKYSTCNGTAHLSAKHGMMAATTKACKHCGCGWSVAG
jgi:hypothetical protein